ncbi:hypothetical protein Csa_002621 [Cucumis sativus]|uniref:Uncharacterized protein n=1 Tax=Cucumis sativus TaxID=3659 RepID=A0A0A0L9M8_CUCSA|nr:hypothetical protein Csa_002621 [Cucumis sativus]
MAAIELTGLCRLLQKKPTIWVNFRLLDWEIDKACDKLNRQQADRKDEHSSLGLSSGVV